MHEYLQSILLPEQLINDLCNDDIDADTPAYLRKVSQLEEMLQKTKGQLPDSKALIEVKPELEKLKFKVCARARNFLIAKMNNLKKPKSNFQIYQQNILVKYKPLVTFLREYHVETYVELSNLYSSMMDEVYYTQLKQYFADTAKLIRPVPKSSDLL